MTTDKKILRRGLTALSLVTALGLSSCTKDLDRFPTNGETSQTIYNSPAKTFQAFAKVYGAFALSGNGGKNEDGNGGDIAGYRRRGRVTSFVASSISRSCLLRRLSAPGVTVVCPTSMR